jgi:hypothetical protein
MPNYYETLNVSINSSFAEVQASYNVLKKMFGADQSFANELDTAMSILSNVDSRAAYDRMMTEAMNKKAALSQVPVELPPLPVEMPAAPVAMKVKSKKKIKSHKPVNIDNVIAFDLNQRKSLKELNGGLASKLVGIACSIAVVAVIMIGITTKQELLSRVGFLGLDEITSVSYERPATAPNGQAFPEVSGYIAGYEQRNNIGISTLVVNNTKNDNDVYFKLVSLEGERAIISRHVMIKAKSEFTIDKLSPGKYEIQYLDLVAGKAGRSEVFTVTEIVNANGSEASRLSVKLKTAINGVLRVESVTVDEFNKLASI